MKVVVILQKSTPYPELQNHISKSEGKPLFFELNSFYKLSPNPQ
mgnify:CR=1 FL=1